MTSEILETKNMVVKCNGGGGVLGHPVVFLNLGTEGKVVCPYCSKCFVKTYSTKAGTKTKGLRRAS
ncbi:MAG: zinc-finger domain-containing protein [Proteobacteria bacterium]|nr:zinc-finger domain-containing protein [Pseudomonadota bacterium]